jgi:hypothetical protein
MTLERAFGCVRRRLVVPVCRAGRAGQQIVNSHYGDHYRIHSEERHPLIDKKQAADKSVAQR